MVLIKRLEINGIPESSFSTACAIGKFNFSNSSTNFLVGSSSELIFRDFPATESYKKCIGAEIIRQQDDNSTISIGKIQKIHSLVRDIGSATSTSAAAVLISINNNDLNSTENKGILNASKANIPASTQAIQISTTKAKIMGSIVKLDAQFQPISAENRGILVEQGFEVSVPKGSLNEEDSGSPVLNSNDELLGMFVMKTSFNASSDRAFCVKTQTLIFMQ